MAKYAFVVGVELFADPKIHQVAFATADAEDLSDVFKTLDFDEVLTLVDSHATRTAVRSKLKKLIDRLQPDDTFCFFIASHGYSEKGKNYVYCHDTQANDLKATTISLQWIYDLLKVSNCKHCIMFLDACETGVEIDDGMRAPIGELSEDELREMFEASEYCVGFAACRSHQRSWSSKRLKHGVWTYCLIQALSGFAKDAIERKRYVTASKLQYHLRREVPRELQRDRPREVQTPWQFGGQSGDFVVADVGGLLAARQTPPAFEMSQLKRVFFRNEEVGAVKALSGFKKGVHHVPKDVSAYGARFIANISESEIAADLEQVYQSVKDAFGYKRRELERQGPNEGVGSVETPAFTYTVGISQNPDGPDSYVLRREITDIKDQDVVFSDEFNDVFDGMFDTLEFEFAKKIDLEKVIDDLEDAGVTFDADSGATYCRISLPKFPIDIVFDAKSIRLIHGQPQPPRELLSAFKQFRELAAQQDLKMLPVA